MKRLRKLNCEILHALSMKSEPVTFTCYLIQLCCGFTHVNYINLLLKRCNFYAYVILNELPLLKIFNSIVKLKNYREGVYFFVYFIYNDT